MTEAHGSTLAATTALPAGGMPPLAAGIGAVIPPPSLDPIPSVDRDADSIDIEALPVARLMGVELHTVTEKEAIAHILRELDFGRGGVTITPNLDHLRRCKSDMQFAAMVSEAELVVADGMPLIWASRIAGCRLPQRVAGSDLILTLSAAAADAGRSIYLLGGAPGTAEGAADVLRTRHPHIKIVGTYCPPLGFEGSEPEMAKLVANLVSSKPDIVFVALGSPKQEYLIERIRSSLPKAWWLGVGVSFSFLTGHVQRAPRFLQKIGLEWLHRLVQEPRRLFKRYIVQGLPFAGQLFASAASQRVSSWMGSGVNDRCYSRSHRSRRGTRYYGTANVDPLAPEPDSSSTAIAVADRAASRGTRETHGTGALSQLKAIILLGGQLRPSPLMQAIGRPILDLPVTDDRTLLNHWLSDAAELARIAKLDHLPVRVLVSRTQDEPKSTAARFEGFLSIETDASEFRGTGGVLSDISRDYDDDDFILVANAAQLLLEPLHALATALDHKRADISLVSHLCGTPSGLTLVRCATLRKINPVGFIDLKEQALPTIAKSFDVRVVHCRRPTGLPLRTPTDYIAALRQYHRGPGRIAGSRRGQIDPMAEDFARGFSIIEPGAWVDSTAYLHDSVILRGARVEPGAAVVRSLIGPKAQVRKDARVIDRFEAE